MTMSKHAVRPSLIVCLGGTGQLVAGRLKKTLYDRFGETGVFRFLSIDTAEQIKQGSETMVLDEAEFLQIGHFNTDRILESIDLHPTVQAWFPRDLKPGRVRGGAKQIRAIGRLAFFWHSGEIYRYLLNLLSQLGEIKYREFETKIGPVVTHDGVDVHLVTSVCGGTGSGMFLDMAFMVAQALRERGIENSTITGYMVLPGAFTAVPSRRIAANALAALMELDESMRRGHFACQYPTLNISLSRKPFDLCYLVDSTNERGRNLHDSSDVARLIADAVYCQVATPMGTELQSQIDNVALRLNSREHRPTAYSSLAVAKLRYPIYAADEVAANKWIEAALSALLRSTAGSNDPISDANNFLNDVTLSSVPDRILDLAKKFTFYKNRPVYMELPPLMGSISEQQQQIRNWWEQIRQREAMVAAAKVQEQVVVWGTETESRLAERIITGLNDPHKGVSYVLTFLEQVVSQLAVIRQNVENIRAQTETQAKNQKAGAERSLQQLRAGGLPWLSNHALNKLDEVKSSLNRSLSTELNGKALAALTEALNSIASQLDARQVEVHQLRSCLFDLVRLAQAQRSAAEKMITVENYPLCLNLMEQNDLEQLYAMAEQDIREDGLAILGERLPAMSTWQREMLPTLYDQLSVIGRDRIRTHRRVQSVDDILVQRCDNQSNTFLKQREQLNELLALAHPFLNYDRAKLRNGWQPDEISVLGVPDADQSFFTDIIGRLINPPKPSSLDCVDEVILLRTRHGLPISALTNLDALMEQYLRTREEDSNPLHASQEWEDFVSSLEPVHTLPDRTLEEFLLSRQGLAAKTEVLS